jgi:hypothetical protein
MSKPAAARTPRADRYPAPATPLAPLAAAEPAASYASVRIDLPVPAGRPDAAEAARAALQSLAPFIVGRAIEQQREVLRSVVDRIIESTPLRAVDAQRAALEQRAIEAVFAGTEWLTAEQIGRLREPTARNPHGAVSRWRTQGKVFAIPKGGVLYHPRYAFDEGFEPRPVVAEVLAVLSADSPYRVASWFESVNGRLGRRRPRELIATDPARVLEAAQAHAVGPVHG